MTEPQSSTGINISFSGLQIIEAVKVSHLYSIENLDQTFISPPLNFDDGNETLLETQIQNAFEEIKSRNQVNITVASFTLPPELFITIQLPYDNNLQHEELIEEFRWELSLLYPFISSDELAIKYYRLENKSLSEHKFVLVVALNKKYLLFCKKFCKMNNLTPKFVDNASVSANHFINNFFSIDNGFSTINIYNSRNSMTLFINNSSKPVYVKVFPKSGSDFIKTIAEELSIKSLEWIKTEPYLEAFITGDYTGDELIDELYSSTSINFKKLNPLELLNVKPGIIVSGLSNQQNYTFTSAAGIASRFK